MENSRLDAIQQYERARKAGLKYYQDAVNRGVYPYPPALDDLIPSELMNRQQELGVVEIPVDLVVGTRSDGRVASLAGNYMPLLPAESEFAAKWVSLCMSHLEEGIRDPIRCYEYMGRFYVQEGHKRLSVLKSFENPAVRASVVRIVPPWSEEHDVQVYYEFMAFYQLSKIYAVEIRWKKGYAQLQALLGFSEDHVWSEEERRSFVRGFSQFRAIYEKMNTEKLPLTAGEALVEWLKVFPFSDTKNTVAELKKSISSLWTDFRAQAGNTPIDISTQPEADEKTIVSRILNIGRSKSVRAAFLYAYPPSVSQWTMAHDLGRQHIENRLSDRVETAVYQAEDRDYFAAAEQAAADGADMIFATTPPMMDACRRTAALHPEIKILNCSLSQPYTGVRTYYPRTYESKFLTGVIAGAMAGESPIGYIANYPIAGVSADINAFALGARLTNPRSRIKLAWSCVEGDAIEALLSQGVQVISNRDAAAPGHAHLALEWGTYMIDGGTMLPLALPCWKWGEFYEQILCQLLDGVWSKAPDDRAVNYWWGLQSGVLDVIPGKTLPEGIRTLISLLRKNIVDGILDPFCRVIIDQNGIVRSDGSHLFSPEERMSMDWLSDTVDGRIPEFDELLPKAKELTRVLGLYRDKLPPRAKGAVE
ncbi:MAG: BMP family ABC transporter substrate-binding protein [Eubacteriales bacterium]|nr:BMP family ABC transporter substrate-binding protein [Eubacteriales bacterium]